MVLEVAGVPRKTLLPLGEYAHQLLRLKASLEPLNADLIALHMLEGEDHIELSPLGQSEIGSLL